MKVNIPTGLFDILPDVTSEPWRSSPLWNYLEEEIRSVATAFGFHEIRTPIFERAEVFLRNVGESSDIVSKEMYLFEDRGGRKMALRPEGTAPVMRAFVENSLMNSGHLHKLFYIGPMFRYDRPQAGRFRQHHQFGVEAIGVGTPEQDVEIIDLLWMLYQRIGLQGVELHINSLGTKEAREQYKAALIQFLEPKSEQLSPDSQKRLLSNPLRILDSKDENDQEILKNAPTLLEFITAESRTHFERVEQLLKELNIPYKINPKLVRGLDYYTGTVFEVMTTDLGAQNSLGGGGRFDGLLKSMGGPDLPTCGFGTGLERVLQTLLRQKCQLPARRRPTIYLIAIGEEAEKFTFRYTHQLRSLGIHAIMDLQKRKVAKALSAASQLSARYALVVGEEELKNQSAELKNLDTGHQDKISFEALPRILQIVEKSKAYLEISEELEKPFRTQEESQFFLTQIYDSLKETSATAEQLKKLLEE